MMRSLGMRMFGGALFFATLVATAEPNLPTGAMRTFGFDDPGEPGKETSWSVYTCPNDTECKVPVRVSLASGVCIVKTYSFIDLSRAHTKTIKWNLEFAADSFKFVAKNGISVPDKTVLASIKTESSAVIGMVKSYNDNRTRHTLYDINLLWKRNDDPFKQCIPRGPVIVSRG